MQILAKPSVEGRSADVIALGYIIYVVKFGEIFIEVVNYPLHFGGHKHRCFRAVCLSFFSKIGNKCKNRRRLQKFLIFSVPIASLVFLSKIDQRTKPCLLYSQCQYFCCGAFGGGGIGGGDGGGDDAEESK